MKSYTSIDSFSLPDGVAFVIRRANPRVGPTVDELPVAGDVVVINGMRYRVRKAAFSGDSEFNWWPEILIYGWRTP